MATMASMGAVLVFGSAAAAVDERAARSDVEPPRRSPALEAEELEAWIWEAAKRLEKPSSVRGPPQPAMRRKGGRGAWCVPLDADG